jgi:hypothetical protein
VDHPQTTGPRSEAGGRLPAWSSHTLPGTHDERGGYLRRVLLAQPAHAERAGRLLELPELYRNIAVLELTALAPGLVERALRTVDELGCLGCSHARHAPGECLVGLVSVDGGASRRYCVCGVPGADVQVEELEAAAFEYAQDVAVQAEAEAQS